MSDQEEVRLPLNPATATLVEMYRPGNANVFAVGVAFPRDSFGDGPQLTIQFDVAPGKILDANPRGLPKELAEALCEELKKRGRMEWAVWTLWPSVIASIQKIIIDFNAKRGMDSPGIVRPQ